jgi:hypothetical protein
VGGDSIFLDTDRTDWLFFGLSKPLMIFYGESVGNVNFGLFFFQPSPFPGVDPAGAGIRYLMEFDFVASVNAHGTFELPFNIHPEPPPLAVMFGPFGGTVTVDEWQALTIHLPHCRSRSDCADDDPCTVETCADGVCQYSPTSCTDNDPCTTDQCDSAVGCFFMPFDCTDFNSCTTDECNALDGCVHVPACVAASDCDDADYCTNEVCTTSGCCVYEPLDCHDDNLCTSDGCLSASGCINEPIDCGDGNQCLAHECDLATGLCEGLPINTGQACDDGDDCTIDDVCTPQGTCAGQPLLNCTPLPAVSGTGMAALCVLLAIGLTIRRPDQ